MHMRARLLGSDLVVVVNHGCASNLHEANKEREPGLQDGGEEEVAGRGNGVSKRSAAHMWTTLSHRVPEIVLERLGRQACWVNGSARESPV